MTGSLHCPRYGSLTSGSDGYVNIVSGQTEAKLDVLGLICRTSRGYEIQYH
jgi:hypothetical protein